MLTRVHSTDGRNGGAVKHLEGPNELFRAWLIHDIEEAIAFPSTCDDLAARTGIGPLRMTAAQSWLAVTIAGLGVRYACRRGTASKGRSRVYRGAVAGLELHVFTHLLASLLRRSYTAGVVTAPLVMLPGAWRARQELAALGRPLGLVDALRGIGFLMPLAIVSHGLARLVLPRARWLGARRHEPELGLTV